MKKTAKYLSFQSLKLELEQASPKEISRAVLCIKDDQSNIYKTQKYGQVTQKTIQWLNTTIQIPYHNQQMFTLQTICEHEYGYQIQELQAMFNGQVYIKTQNFFRPLTIHIFGRDGTKCGVLRYLIKVIEKEVVKSAKVKAEVIEEKQSVKVQLIGKVTLYSAQLLIQTPTFKKQKYQSDLQINVHICGKKIEGTYKKNFQWSFINGSKIQYMENSQNQVLIQLKQGNQVILAGDIQMLNIMENKRFVTHTISMYNVNQSKIGVLKLDLRFITKQQLLDLMYSPTKLSKNPQKSPSSDQPQIPMDTFKKSRINSSSQMQTTRKHENLKQSHVNLQQIQSYQRLPDRYKKVHVTNSYNQIIFSKAKRFSQPKYVNPYVSYSDPNKLSDFSPDNKNGYRHVKGADISASRKMDFTRQYKNNPGVGQYKLPSIWDKY